MAEGYAKLYEIFQSLKVEYDSELKWVIPYPGAGVQIWRYGAAISTQLHLCSSTTPNFSAKPVDKIDRVLAKEW